MTKSRAGFLAGAAALLGALGLWRMLPSTTTPKAPGPVAPAKYVDNGVCLGCHQEEARLWQDWHETLGSAQRDVKVSLALS